jgi:hypothetical protein
MQQENHKTSKKFYFFLTCSSSGSLLSVPNIPKYPYTEIRDDRDNRDEWDG